MPNKNSDINPLQTKNQTLQPQLGLTSVEAKEQLKTWGPNTIVPSKWWDFLTSIKKILLDPMGLMLLCLSGLYLMLGERTDALILFLAFIPITAVDVILELQSNKALRALKASLTPFAKVYRDGRVREISIHELVPKDVLIFEEGQTLPADGILLKSTHLNINESSLTGESIPILKNVNDIFLSGTSVISGHGIGIITKTGRHSQMGQIAGLVENISESKSPLRKTVDKFVQWVAIAAICMAVLLYILQYFHTQNWIASLISALTLGMSAIPEEFPLVFTLYLSMGAWRLSKKGVLIKSLPSVESLGSVDVICTDKTGTLTEGLFQMERPFAFSMSSSFSHHHDSPESLATTKDIKTQQNTEDRIKTYALAACETPAVDSMEVAIHKYYASLSETPATEFSASEYSPSRPAQMVIDFPFENEGKHMTHVWQYPQSILVAMKGAIEGVTQHCRLTTVELEKIQQITNNLSSQGKRLLGLAGKQIALSKSDSKSLIDGTSWETQPREFFEKDLEFLGFLIFSDPIRSSVIDAIQQCQHAGIQIKMLTGDHLLTAHSVANQIGLSHDHDFLFTGQDLLKMTNEQKEKAYLQGALFARVLPEQKYEMVKTLQKHQLVVAMTGDGINDAPALRQADIGISMGVSATDVARSTAKMILMKNDFAGIIAAVFEGRQIFANLQDSFSYLISFHIPVILLALVPPFFNWPSLLQPIHIILLELIVHPISAFTFENRKTKKLSKNPKGGLLSLSQVLSATLKGIAISLTALVVYWWSLQSFSIATDATNTDMQVNLSRSLAFAIVLFGNAFYVLDICYPQLHRRFYWTMMVLLVSTGLICLYEPLGHFLHLQQLSWTSLSFCFVAAGASVLLVPLLILTSGRFSNNLSGYHKKFP